MIRTFSSVLFFMHNILFSGIWGCWCSSVGFWVCFCLCGFQLHSLNRPFSHQNEVLAVVYVRDISVSGYLDMKPLLFAAPPGRLVCSSAHSFLCLCLHVSSSTSVRTLLLWFRNMCLVEMKEVSQLPVMINLLNVLSSMINHIGLLRSMEETQNYLHSKHFSSFLSYPLSILLSLPSFLCPSLLSLFPSERDSYRKANSKVLHLCPG